MKKLSCESCGSTDLEKQKGCYVCNVCGTKFVVEKENQTDVIPQGITDFSCSEKECLLSVKEWLIQSDYAPDDILTNSKIGPLKRLYIPMYIFSGDYTANWSADSGYNRVETYTEYEKRTVNGRTVTEPVTKKRTVTDWHPSSGTVTGAFVEFSSANNEIERILVEYLETKITFTRDFDVLSDLDKENKNILPYEMSENESFQLIKSRLSNQIDQNVCDNIPGDTYRDVNWTPTLSNQTTLRLYYPAYVGTYEYNGKTYSFIIDGKNVDNLYGHRPRDNNRVEKVENSAVLVSKISIATNILSVLSFIYLFKSQMAYVGFTLLFNLALMVLSLFCYFYCLKTVKQVAIKQKARRMKMLDILYNNKLSDDEKEKQLAICAKMNVTREELAKYSNSKNLNTLSSGINYKVKNKAFDSLLISFIGPAFVVVITFFLWFAIL